jgi:peptidoglycan hydrolase-like amidase
MRARRTNSDSVVSKIVGNFMPSSSRFFYSAFALFVAAPICVLAATYSGPGVLPAPGQAHVSPLLKTAAAQSPAAQFPAAQAATTPQPVRAAPIRYVRVGLSTKGAPIQLMAKGAMTISDVSQPDRRLPVKAGEIATFTFGANARIAASGREYSGPITIRTDGGTYPAWQMPRVWTSGNFTRVSTDGETPRWQRAYRGHFEIAPLTYSFEPATHKGALRLVNLLPLEEYLKGVVPWEMNKSAPLEALKAQAICARSESLSKIRTGRHAKDGFEICDYDHCQGYPGTENESERTSLAVEQTEGMVLFYKGQIADAVYGTNSGGITAADVDVWRGSHDPYLASRGDFSPALHPATAQIVKPNMTESDWVAYCSTNLPSFAQPSRAQITELAARRAKSPRTAALYQPGDLPEFYRWSRVINPYDLAKALAARFKTPMNVVSAIRVEERAPSGHIKKLLIVGQMYQNGKIVKTSTVRLEGDSQIRALVSGRLGSTTALPSSTFVVAPRFDAQKKLQSFVLRGAGWGHGVGMCQRGAQNRALAGWNAWQILQFYYRDIELRKIS